MMGRKKLKDNVKYKGTYINDDLTVLRSKLLNFVKESGRFGRVWTVAGRIHVSKKVPVGTTSNGNERPLVISNADELFDIGFDADSIDPEKLGLADYWVE